MFDDISKLLSEELAKEINKNIINELTDPYSDFNDPNGYKKKARDIRIDREKKLKRIFKDEID